MQRERGTRILWFARWVAIAIALAVVAVPADAKKPPKPPKHELNLDVVVPKGHDTALQFSSGWALTLHMRTDESRLLGIGKADYPPTLPGLGVNGWLVFDDPDGCPSFITGLEGAIYKSVYCDHVPSSDYPLCDPPDWTTMLPYACPDQAPSGYDWWADVAAMGPWPADETWVEFRPGVSQPASVPQAEQEPRPEVWVYGQDCNWADSPPDPLVCWGVWKLWGVGPYLGSEDDLIRYGRWDLLPGLVVLADHGPGLLTVPIDPALPPYDLSSPGTPTVSHFFDPPSPVEARNLAGFFNAIGYTLLADITAPVGEGETTMTAQMVAPNGLFMPVVLRDSDITIGFSDDYDVWCEPGNSAYRLDGGPLTCYPGSLSSVDPVINNTSITLRIFVVHGDAPDLVYDQDGDHVLDIDDVEAMGFRPVTGEEVVRIFQHHQLECGNPYDFDGNGNPGGCVLGARAGGITGVPR